MSNITSDLSKLNSKMRLSKRRDALEKSRLTPKEIAGIKVNPWNPHKYNINLKIDKSVKGDFAGASAKAQKAYKKGIVK